MSSKRRSAANRRNAQHSTGPKTPEGKAASARNASTHGLSSSFAVLPHEDRSAYAQLLETLQNELTPATEHETFLVHQMAESRWRLDRAHRFEAVAYEQLLDEFDKTNPDHIIVVKLTNRTANIFDLLQRYANAAERSYYRAHKELTQGRKNEERNEATDPQAWLKAQLAQDPIPPIHHPVWHDSRNEANSAGPSADRDAADPELRL